MTDLEKYLRWRGFDCHVVTNCEDYENCDVCLVDHIKKHDAKVRANAIDDLLSELPHKALINRKYILDVAEQLKEKKND